MTTTYRPSRRLVGGVGLAVAVCTLAWGLRYAGAPVTDGPIREAPAHATALDDLEVGDRFTYGLNVLDLEGDREAVVTDISVVGLDDGVRFLGARLGGPDRAYGSRQLIRSWPPRRGDLDVRPLATPLTPLSVDPIGWELLIGLEIAAPGRFVSDGWLVTYEVAGRTYRQLVPARIRICTPETLPADGPCPVPSL